MSGAWAQATADGGFSGPLSVHIREVGPRDGLQAESPVPVAERVRLIEALLDAGVAHIEACSFVSPAAVPSMAGGAEVLAALGRRPGVKVAALVPNLKGAQLALSAGVDELTATVSASEAYSQKNVRRSVEESIGMVAEVAAAASSAEGGPVPVDAVISCAFGSPYEGDISPGAVAAIARRLLDAGVARCTYADTTGMATPRRVGELLGVVPGRDVGLHLHETRGTGLLNAWSAIQAGVVRFDTAIGGLGGSPFAAGAAGNLATEDLVHLCEDAGLPTGIDLERLLAASAVAAEVVGHSLPSRVAAAGPRTRLVPVEG